MLSQIEQAKMLYDQGEIDRAIELVTLVVNKEDNLEALHLLSMFYIEQNQFSKAQDYLEKALKIAPKQVVINLHLANVLKAQKKFSEAEVLLLSLLEEEIEAAPLYNNLGSLYFAQHKFPESKTAFQKAIELRADYADAYYNLGLALTRLKDWQGATNAYDALLSLQPMHVGALFQLGLISMVLHQFNKAIEYFLIIEKAYPYHFETQTNLATSYLRLAKYLPAKTHYLKAHDIFPGDAQVLFNLGILEMQQGHAKEAIHYYVSALKIDPTLVGAHNNLGIAYMATKDTVSAIRHFKAVLEIDPNNEPLKHTIDIIERHKTLSTSPPSYIRALFDSYAGHYDAHLLEELHYQVPALIAKKVEKIASLDWQVLDLGCGTGLCGEKIASFVGSMTGIDLSPEMLALAAEKNIYANLLDIDILLFLEKHVGIYHLIIAGDVLVYMGSLQALFQQAYLSLQPGGYFIFNIEEGAEDSYQMTSSGRFAHNESYVIGLAEQYGFAIQHLDHIVIREQNKQPVRGCLFVLQRALAC